MDIYSDEQTCRICLTIQDTTYSIFSKRKGLSAKEKLDKIGLKLDENDSGPMSICCNCLRELEMTIIFLEKCEKSNEILAAINSQGVVITKEIASSQENLKSDIDNNTLDISQDAPECDLSANSKIDDNISVILDEKCVSCGSKRRCAHWTPPATHTCPYCQRVFSRKYSFKLHLKRHSGSREWWCSVCGAGAVSRSLATRHCAAPRRRACPAPDCRRTYTSGTNLRNHLRTHSGERPFQCSDCDKTFSSKDTLKNHMRIHTGALPYICPHCGKQFRTNKLSAHMRVHAGEGWRKRETATCARERATHACVTCGAIYRHKQSLKKHVRRQHAQKPVSAEDSVSQP